MQLVTCNKPISGYYLTLWFDQNKNLLIAMHTPFTFYYGIKLVECNNSVVVYRFNKSGFLWLTKVLSHDLIF
jgi:hypothetical protein